MYLFCSPLLQNVNEYEEKTFINVSKDDVKLNEASDEADKERQKRATAFYKGLGGWWRGVIRDPSISSVRISRRLSTTPCVVVSGKWGWSATMERIAKAQALTDPHRSAAMRGKRTLEINPKHPLIKELRNKVRY